jgi:nicotinamide-nucleotide amidase
MGTYAEIIAVGSELLSAGRVDTNSVWIADRLAELGLRVCLKTCAGDGLGELRACMASAVDRVGRTGRRGLIVTTGGLGPTFDDRTKEAFADALGVRMFEDAKTRLDIDAFFGAKGQATPENNYGQALIPEGAMAIPNSLGTAPGVYWDAPKGRKDLCIVMLPGVPREMMGMWMADVHPRLLGLAEEPTETLRLVVGGVGESALDERTKHVRARHSHLDWTILAHGMHIEILARSKSADALGAARLDMEAELGQDLVCVGSGSPESTLLDLLVARSETLAIAESVTGGLLASRLTAVPGASRALLGGVVAYTPESKARLLGIDPDFIKSNGTVGEAMTLEMASRARGKLGAAWGLAITGNAGPTPDPNAKQNDACGKIGRCYIAVADGMGAACRHCQLHGTRQDIQFRAANWAMDTLRRRLAAK